MAPEVAPGGSPHDLAPANASEGCAEETNDTRLGLRCGPDDPAVQKRRDQAKLVEAQNSIDEGDPGFQVLVQICRPAASQSGGLCQRLGKKRVLRSVSIVLFNGLEPQLALSVPGGNNRLTFCRVSHKCW